MKDPRAFQAKLQKVFNKIASRERACLSHDCENIAIGSHVLQGNGILGKICDDTNHFMMIGKPGSYFADGELPIKISKIGLRDGYKFPGFCKHHDDALFSPIEKNAIDFSNWKHLCLLSYRTLCLEIRLKEINAEQIRASEQVQKDFFGRYYLTVMEGLDSSLRELHFYKSELEAELNAESPERFTYSYVELPLRQICFSSPQNNFDPNNPKSHVYYDKYGDEIGYLATAILNFFPYFDKSYFVLATHNEYECLWSKTLLDKLKSGENYDKILSDILTYKILFWAMSPDMFNRIPDANIEKYKEEVIRTIDNHEVNFESEFNLFE